MITFLRLFESPESVIDRRDGIPMPVRRWNDPGSVCFACYGGEVYVMPETKHVLILKALLSNGILDVSQFPEEEVQPDEHGVMWYHRLMAPAGRIWHRPKGDDDRQILSFWTEPTHEDIEMIMDGDVTLVKRTDDPLEPFLFRPVSIALDPERTFIEYPTGNLQPVGTWTSREMTSDERDMAYHHGRRHTDTGPKPKTSFGSRVAGNRARAGGFNSVAQMRAAQTQQAPQQGTP